MSADEKEPAWPILTRLNKFLRPQSAPAPTTPATPEIPKSTLTVVDYLKAWKTLQGVPVEQLGALAILIPLTVFFAISGLIAWVVIFIGFVLRLLWLILFRRRKGS
ncbi:hypothetical protein EBZ39_01395 [bacterium]|nr:hypothetical protein [bacterium]